MSSANRIEERDARDEAAELAHTSRTQDISDRLSALIDAASTSEERIRWESLAVAIAYDIKTNHELGDLEYAEWLALVGEPRG